MGEAALLGDGEEASQVPEFDAVEGRVGEPVGVAGRGVGGVVVGRPRRGAVLAVGAVLDVGAVLGIADTIHVVPA
ncbi:hypothetical protein [Streptomyces noursei]|uniref:hypothetical protein n=1 Tax=Streptomyces noursei TaxID=1971 RepID=UPI0022A72522|nr:hypothetical protein [Streptomyces noursei]MCZ1016070.1 hypothetical protein [Streptomyces noursei]